MSYFVTGATGFIGRHLVERLLEREGDIHVLVREGSREKLDALIERWGAADRIKPVVGDLSEARLGVESPPEGIDPIVLEIIQGTVESMRKEMELQVERTARSVIIRERRDYRLGRHGQARPPLHGVPPGKRRADVVQWNHAAPAC